MSETASVLAPQPEFEEDPTRERILREAAKLFEQCGYSATTTRAIATAAGITVGSIYWHFPSKEAILYAYLLSQLQWSKVRLTMALAMPTPLQQLREFVWAYRLDPRDPPEERITLRGPHGLSHMVRFLSAEQQRDLRQLERDCLDVLRQILETGVETGEFRPLDVTPTAFAIISLCEQMYTWWKPDGRLNVDGVVALYEDLIYRMVVPMEA